MFEKVLIVCVGNICRSPMAEYIFRDACHRLEKSMVFESAGIGALVGHSADETVVNLMQAQDIDVSMHRARQLTREVSTGFDLILVMETGHIRAVEQMIPEARGKVHLLGKWNQNEEIADPYKQSEAHFKASLSAIERGVQAWRKYL